MKQPKDFKAVLQSNKLRAIGSQTNGESEFDKVRKQLAAIAPTKPKKEHKDRTVVKKQKACFIYIGELKAHPGILITQVRTVDFMYLEECEAWCEEHLSSYTIKDPKANVLIKKVAEQ